MSGGKKKVLVFGTFDILHKGHEYFLEKAASHGNLYVVVARDRTVKTIKGDKPLHNEKKRFERIAGLDYVCKAVLGHLGNKLRIVEDIAPDIICLGYDQHFFIDELFNYLETHKDIEVIKIAPYMAHKYKSSLIRKNGL